MEDSCIIVIDFCGNIFLYQRKAHAIERETASISSIYTENFLPGRWNGFLLFQSQRYQTQLLSSAFGGSAWSGSGGSDARIEMWASRMATEGAWNEGKIHAWRGKHDTSDWDSCSGRSGVREEVLALALCIHGSWNTQKEAVKAERVEGN